MPGNYNVRIGRKDLREKLAKRKKETGKSIERIVAEALDEHFNKER